MLSKLKILFVLIFGSFVVISVGAVDNQNANQSFIDSAENVLDEDPELALSFLEKITSPEQNLPEDKLANFFYARGKIYDRLDERAKVYSSYSKAIYYAESSGDLKLAGDVSYSLSSYLFWMHEDERANAFLNKAQEYFTRIDDEEGRVKILSMPAYRAYLAYDYVGSNELILKGLDQFRSFEKEDTYYSLLTDFMLISNYLHLENIDSADVYFAHFKSLENHPNTLEYTFDYYLNIIYVCYVDYYYDQGQLDSALHYLDITMQNRSVLDYNSLTDIYLFLKDIYLKKGEIALSANYEDSLRLLQEDLVKTNVSAEIDVQDEIEALNLKQKGLSKKTKTAWLVMMLAILVALISSFFVFVYRARQQKKLEKLNLKLNEQSFLKKQQDKLQIKIKGLEDYLSILKSEVSEIAYLKDVTLQKKRIQELYKDLHLKLLDNDANTYDHLTLVNKLNPTFYVVAQEKFPELNEGEIIICYYIFIGLKNKEIAVFLNTTVRSVEGKRLRISKKIDLPEGETLVNYLVHVFSDIPE